MNSATLLLQQAEYLLNDEIDYAKALRTQRSTIASLLVVIVGIGLFRVSFFGSDGDVLLIGRGILIAVAVLFTLAAICIICGAWTLYSEKPFIRRQSAEDHLGDADTKKLHDQLSQGKSSAALAVLNLDSRHRRLLEQASPLVVTHARTKILRVAYERLAAANRRVRYRIDRGRLLLLLGLTLVFLAFLVYLWSLVGRCDTIGGGSENDCSAGVEAINRDSR